MLLHDDVIPLHDRETGQAAGRFTRQVRAEERDAMAAADALARRRSGAVSARSAQRRWPSERHARPEAVFVHVCYNRKP
jgi:hypothetical protein